MDGLCKRQEGKMKEKHIFANCCAQTGFSLAIPAVIISKYNAAVKQGLVGLFMNPKCKQC